MEDKIMQIPKEKFTFVQKDAKLHDKKLDTKPVGFIKDAWNRFKKNKGSVVAACVVLFLILFAIVGPFFFDQNYIASYELDKDIKLYKFLDPKISFLDGTGFWDGSKKVEITADQYAKYKARGVETGYDPIQTVHSTYTSADNLGEKKMYSVQLDEYHIIDVFTKTWSLEEYQAMQQWQDENNLQIILPWVDYCDPKSDVPYIKESVVKFNNLNYWWACDDKGNPVLDDDGNLIPGYRVYEDTNRTDYYESMRIAGDPGIEDPESAQRYLYTMRGGSKKTGYTYTCRINPYNYFIYKYGFEPAFVFGSTDQGYDVLTRLASGAQFSLILALSVSAINLFIGAIYGAIEGYYGGKIDLVMERISDILASVPSIVVTVLFAMFIQNTVLALLYAFVMTGWIGMASRTRMQFYRFKNHEYVLAARTLGARDARIMFKHIFPNSLGTIITGSILSIPGVIFSETSLSYLGIIDLDSPTRAAVGAMLNAGQLAGITAEPHLVIFPSLFIGLLMVSFNLFGNGLRDAFNPSLRGSEE